MSLLLEYLLDGTAPQKALLIVSTVTRLGNGSVEALARPDMQGDIARYNNALPTLLSRHNQSGMDSEAGFEQPLVRCGTRASRSAY